MLSRDFGEGNRLGRVVRRGAWLIVPLTLLLWPAWLGDYVGDDHRLIERNVAINTHDFATMLSQPLFGIEDGYWRPATVLGFWLGHTLAGAFGVHLLAFALHVAATFAVRSIAERFLSAPGARWVALAFALHPVQAESLSWCAALNDVLWGLAALFAMLATVAWRDRGGRLRLLAIGGWCLLALLAKETGIVALPLAVVAAAWLPSPSGLTPWVRWRVLFAVLTAVLVSWGLARALALREPIGASLFGLGGNSIDFDLVSVAEIFHAQVTLLVWPFPYLPVREVPPVGGMGALVVVLLGLAAATAACRHWCDSRWGFALAILVLPVVPSLLHHDTIGLYSIADRYLYLSTAGLALLAASVPTSPVHWLRWGLLGAMAVCTFQGTFLRRDDGVLAGHTLVYLPDDPGVLAMAADARLSDVFDGDPFAIAHCERLYVRAMARIELRQESEQRKRTLATAQLGLAWCGLMRWSAGGMHAVDARAQVLAAFQRAVTLDPRDPAAWVGLGVASGEFEQFDLARAAFSNALVIEPGNPAAVAGLRRLDHRLR